MAKPVDRIKSLAQSQWPGAAILGRGPGFILHRNPANSAQFRFDTIAGGHGWHFGAGNNEVDISWSPASISDQPYQFIMGQSYYQALAFPGNDQLSTAGLIRYRDNTFGTGATVDLTVQSLQYTNGSQLDPVATPLSIGPTAMTDSQIDWVGGFGAERDFAFEILPTRINKKIILQSPGALPVPGVSGNVYLSSSFFFSPSGVDVFINGALWDRGQQLQEALSPLEFRLTGTGEQAFAFRVPMAWDNGGSVVAGRLFVRRQGNTLICQSWIPYNWLSDPARLFPIYFDPTLDYYTGASEDDGSEISSTVYYTFPTTGLIGDNDYVASRFTGVTIPSGATIDSAYWEGNLWTTSRDSPKLDLFFDDSSNPGDLTGTAPSGRTGTTALTATSDSNVGTGFWGSAYDLVDEVAELQASYDYSSGSAMFFMGMGNSASCSCDFDCYDGSNAHHLNIVYTEAGGAAAGFMTTNRGYWGP